MKSWTLIVGMDFSDFGERAFRQAVRMAAHRAGECVVHIAHAVTEKDMASPGSKVERQAEALGHAPREIWNRVVKILEQEQFARVQLERGERSSEGGHGGANGKSPGTEMSPPIVEEARVA